MARDAESSDDAFDRFGDGADGMNGVPGTEYADPQGVGTHQEEDDCKPIGSEQPDGMDVSLDPMWNPMQLTQEDVEEWQIISRIGTAIVLPHTPSAYSPPATSSSPYGPHPNTTNDTPLGVGISADMTAEPITPQSFNGVYDVGHVEPIKRTKRTKRTKHTKRTKRSTVPSPRRLPLKFSAVQCNTFKDGPAADTLLSKQESTKLLLKAVGTILGRTDMDTIVVAKSNPLRQLFKTHAVLMKEALKNIYDFVKDYNTDGEAKDMTWQETFPTFVKLFMKHLVMSDSEVDALRPQLMDTEATEGAKKAGAIFNDLKQERFEEKLKIKLQKRKTAGQEVALRQKESDKINKYPINNDDGEATVALQILRLLHRRHPKTVSKSNCRQAAKKPV
jgi:hypothetical protein